jgi:lipopolysaccharide transport system ATP-binding protein
MDDLHSGGRTVLFVSHNMAAIENLCSRSLWIDGGRLRMDAETHEVIAAYMSSFATGAGEGYDVRNIEGRRGNGDIRFTKFAFLTADGEAKHVIR